MFNLRVALLEVIIMLPKQLLLPVIVAYLPCYYIKQNMGSSQRLEVSISKDKYLTFESQT